MWVSGHESNIQERFKSLFKASSFEEIKRIDDEKDASGAYLLPPERRADYKIAQKVLFRVRDYLKAQRFFASLSQKTKWDLGVHCPEGISFSGISIGTSLLGVGPIDDAPIKKC